MKPRSQLIAQAAFDRVVARKDADDKKAYGAMAHKLPILILQNGLAQATGFLCAKEKKENLHLLDDLTQVLHDTGEASCATSAALRNTIINADTDKTMHLTRRSLEAAGWIKRYVQGGLKVDASGNVTDQEAPT